jgi:hypothetical protein
MEHLVIILQNVLTIIQVVDMVTLMVIHLLEVVMGAPQQVTTQVQMEDLVKPS